MPKYHVYGIVTGTKYLGEYEADTEEIAVESALKDANSIGLCQQCAYQVDDLQLDDARAELES